MPRLLIVEDHRLLRELLEADLVEQGYGVTVVDDGMAARRALQNETFDAVIVDAVLPSGASGIEIAHSAREYGIPVIVTSGWPATIAKLDAETYHFLRKPFHLAQLHEVLRAILPVTCDHQDIPVQT